MLARLQLQDFIAVRNRDAVDAIKKSIRKWLRKGNAKSVAEREDYLIKCTCKYRKSSASLAKLVTCSTATEVGIIADPAAPKIEGGSTLT